ncbi:hypothetical protein COCC4DRAFT_129925 [Bipolaris maydis ATCC 48331]|uniref:PSI domain-containing protein n=2 Tax=Cochliobolus heterostrophus TaxID=5016 RepID=M2U0T5_COCH5|nr:uncharacterized protein COCC4DRAFT_129925 [Bipolaris maydis ATCC 48331]EMD92164.1 hypothetical protein COCHEDRAFT_1101126 [Bipolaris maydis C5]KAJ5022023.1 hypothetical protein J3E73DRAFT_198157 [Bipolaris maydis]ENI07855.1 hypothetical protein COCC4DRAFT_129925 [Bipolaris maydis ATCC 48331]KAJ6197845.1 hypothetical protein J3E72DRAFT_416502 [Bipolaris maydis]KAJ6209969.1 hypothetical protein PSV09DRAFT_1101126 [Bipolaris maydis]
MPSNCPASSAKRDNDALLNTTELFHQRLQKSPKEDWERLKLCWGYMDCGDCHRSPGHCGWCAISSTCLPLPLDGFSRAFPLLSPIRHHSICAMGSERFELRTAGLGCQVSTITFLTSLVTIFCTLFGVLVLYGVSKCVGLVVVGARARRGGHVLFEDGRGGVWEREREGWGKWWRRVRGEEREGEVEVVDEGTGRRGFVWWNERGTERRPLLQ